MIYVHKEKALWPKEWMATWIANSKGVPLDVTIDIHDSYSTEEVISGLRLLLRTIRRWRTLEIDESCRFARIINPFVLTNSVTELRILDNLGDPVHFEYSQTRRKRTFP